MFPSVPVKSMLQDPKLVVVNAMYSTVDLLCGSYMCNNANLYMYNIMML